MPSRKPLRDRDEYIARSPVQESLDMLRRLKDEGQERILVALSGGKDSTAVFDLCTQVFGEEHVQPYHFYLLKGLRCEQEPLEKILRRYPKAPPLISLLRPGVRFMLAHSQFRTITPSIEERFHRRSPWNQNAAERVVRFRSGIRWIAMGHRIFDSIHRRGMLHACNGVWRVSEKTGKPIQRIYPIYKWRPEDVYSYLKARRLPIPQALGQVHKSSGTMISNPHFLLHLQSHYPDDYARLKRVFPNIDLSILRDTVRAAHNIENQLEG